MYAFTNMCYKKIYILPIVILIMNIFLSNYNKLTIIIYMIIIE